jgi:hypothetical protein
MLSRISRNVFPICSGDGRALTKTEWTRLQRDITTLKMNLDRIDLHLAEEAPRENAGTSVLTQNADEGSDFITHP